MSMMGGAPREHGSTIASFPSHEGAQKAVSALIAADIPAKDIAIVGRSLRSVETVTGRLGYASAARSGAINGILLGLLFSAIFVLGTPDAAIQLFIGVMFVGIALGMLLSLITYALMRRRRDYTSITQLIADHYEVTVLPTSLHHAREVLGRTAVPAAPPTAVHPVAPAHPAHPAPATPEAPSADRAPEPAPDLTEPPRYGERITPPPSEPDETSTSS